MEIRLYHIIIAAPAALYLNLVVLVVTGTILVNLSRANPTGPPSLSRVTNSSSKNFRTPLVGVIVSPPGGVIAGGC